MVLPREQLLSDCGHIREMSLVTPPLIKHRVAEFSIRADVIFNCPLFEVIFSIRRFRITGTQMQLVPCTAFLRRIICEMQLVRQ